MKKFIIAFLICLPQLLFSLPSYTDIVDKGDRNLKIINSIYEKYPFMPAKKQYYQNLESKWIKDKTYYINAPAEERNTAFDQLLMTYRTTNEVLKDICIDMANLTDNLMNDFTEKLVDIEAKRIKVKSDRYHNRYMVSRRQFSRAENGFRKSLFYYSASLYDHGVDLMISIYQENNWAFKDMPVLVEIANKQPEKTPLGRLP